MISFTYPLIHQGMRHRKDLYWGAGGGCVEEQGQGGAVWLGLGRRECKQATADPRSPRASASAQQHLRSAMHTWQTQ